VDERYDDVVARAQRQRDLGDTDGALLAITDGRTPNAGSRVQDKNDQTSSRHAHRLTATMR